MPFQYTTEYRLSRRGRVCRTYSGFQALLAIALDLALGFVFGLIGLGLWVARRCLMTAYRVAVALAGFPFKAIRVVVAPRARRAVVKPAWASFDEL